MEFGLLDGGVHAEYTGVEDVEMSKIFAMHSRFFYGAAPIDGAYHLVECHHDGIKQIVVHLIFIRFGDNIYTIKG